MARLCGPAAYKPGYRQTLIKLPGRGPVAAIGGWASDVELRERLTRTIAYFDALLRKNASVVQSTLRILTIGVGLHRVTESPGTRTVSGLTVLGRALLGVVGACLVACAYPLLVWQTSSGEIAVAVSGILAAYLILGMATGRQKEPPSAAP